ncbi:MAG: hypothetical protein ABIZ56_10105 [Chthoniobacteraceae bacterium]
MQLHRADWNHMELAGIDFLCCQFILQIIPSAAATDDPAIQNRLYSQPTGGREPEFERDWKEYVQPDLRNIFETAREVVEADLRKFEPTESDESSNLRIPMKNLEAWIHTLNQARLAISARHDFNEEDMEKAVSLAGGARGLALFQVHFYGFVQECFLQQLEDL